MSTRPPEEPDAWLGAALRALADDDAAAGASPGVEARLRAEVRSVARVRSRRRTRVASTIVVVLLIAVAATTRRMTAPPPPGDTSVEAVVMTEAGAAMAEMATEFFPLLYSEVPAVEPQIVRLELPRTALALFGLGAVESVKGQTAETVSADVLVGEDGLARAVRFVTRASHGEQEP